MTQMDLASDMDVSRALVSSGENGKAIPNDMNLQQLRTSQGETNQDFIESICRL